MTAARERSLPRTFQSLATLRVLNVLAVASSLAAMTGAAFAVTLGERFFVESGVASCVSTFAYGAIWAMLLRSRRTILRADWRVGWVLAVPLAALNGGTAAAIAFGGDPGLHVIGGFFVGLTVGACVWIPALIATLVCFGVPIARAQRMAKRGVAGEEKGERFIGAITTAVGLLALALLASTKNIAGTTSFFVVTASATLAILCGGLAAALAHLREEARRSFVRAVEAGTVEGYRIDPSHDGKVLIRVGSAGEGYRVAAFDDPVYLLHHDGEASAAISDLTTSPARRA